MQRTYAVLLLVTQASVSAQAIRAKADDPAFQEQWRQMKQAAKVRALARISEATGVQLPENAMLDVQARRS